MGTDRRMRLIVASLLALLLLAGCGENSGGDAAIDSSDPPPATSPGEQPPPPGVGQPGDPPPDAADGVEQVDAWFVRQHESGVWLEPETVPLDEATVGVLRAAVEAIINGRAANPDLVSLVPPDTRILDVRIEDGLAVIDMSADIVRAAGGSAQEVAFAQQLAQTATQFDTVDAVRLLVEGEPVTELWGHVDWSEPVSADPQMLSPIIIEQPAWGAQQPDGPVTASGTSNTFESTVELRLIDPSGTVVEETFTTAAQPAVDQRGPWQHTFDVEATTPGTWTIEAVEPDPSGGEGRPAFTTSVQFEVA